MKKLIFAILVAVPLLALGQSATPTSITKNGSSSLTIEKIWELADRLRGGEPCDYTKVEPVAQEQATRSCPFDSRFDSFRVVGKAEAFVPFCAQGGDCGWNHQCIIHWQVTCER